MTIFRNQYNELLRHNLSTEKNSLFIKVVNSIRFFMLLVWHACLVYAHWELWSDSCWMLVIATKQLGLEDASRPRWLTLFLLCYPSNQPSIMIMKKYLLIGFLNLLVSCCSVIDLLSFFVNNQICQRLKTGFRGRVDLKVRDCLNFTLGESFMKLGLIPLCSKYDLSLFTKIITII
jgi:hypothetical protein